MPIVPVNSMVRAADELGSIPLRPGENLYLRDVARIEDGTDIPTGHTLVGATKGVFMLVTKRADASTLAVVNEVKAALPRMPPPCRTTSTCASNSTSRPTSPARWRASPKKALLARFLPE